MEIGQIGDVSFGLSVADEKIKLIDFLSEDDYFLVSSPFSDHHSLQPSSISELDQIILEEKEQNVCVKECRPSFVRRSLAWDTAFFNSSGILDADELFIISNGAHEISLLPSTHEVRNRRSESENDIGFSAEWFEIESSNFQSNLSKGLSGLKHNFQASRKGDKSSRNKVKPDRTSTGKGIDIQSQSKMKKETRTTRRAGNTNNLSGTSNPNMEKMFLRNSFGLGMEEKSTNKSTSSNLEPHTSLSSPKISPFFSPAPPPASTLSKIQKGFKKTQISPSPQPSNISRLSARKEGIGNISASTQATNFCSSPVNSALHFRSSAALLSPVHKQRRSVDSSDVKEASKLQKSIRVSRLRPPSPNLRFFDESTPQQAERSRKKPQRKPSSQPATAIDEQKGKKEVRASVLQLDNLCRNFEAVALDNKKTSSGLQASSVVKEENKQLSSSTTTSSRRRTPLADKTSKCNFSAAFASPMETKKGKLVRASSVRYG